jgi:phage portal protein BeeE
VSVIADSLSSLPVDLMSSPHRRRGQILPPSQLVVQPYEEISTIDWWVQFAMSLALRGNFYGEIVDRDQDLYPTQIRPVHPDHVAVRRAPDKAIEYRFNGGPCSSTTCSTSATCRWPSRSSG